MVTFCMGLRLTIFLALKFCLIAIFGNRIQLELPIYLGETVSALLFFGLDS